MSTVVCQNTMPQDPTTSIWGCIESRSNTHDSHKPEVYVHPLVKRSTSMMSDKSLEMCTESLGSETGTHITEEDVFSLTMSTNSVVVSKEPRRRNNATQRMQATKALYDSIPPPLTILRGVNSIRVDPIREDGRLVMNVVSTSPRKPSVIAQRINGRLTMCLADDDVVVDEEGTSHGVDSGKREEERKTGDGDYEESALEQEEGYENEEEELRKLVVVVKEEDKNILNVEVEGRFGIREKLLKQGRRSCKESEHGRRSRRLNNWKTYWVA